jgi:carbonic anhydrase/acetyltransferase-like protein (isoleucine patch superfamily)
MSSMIIGRYLIIKKVIFDDYVVVGGQATIAPGTIIGKDTVIGALSTTNFLQYLEESWIYFGIPAIQLKPNKFAESRKDIIKKVDVDEVRKYKVKHEINIENDK